MSTKANECLTTSRSYIKNIKLPMGCLSSRSTISPSDINESRSQNSTTTNGKLIDNNNQTIINNTYRRRQQEQQHQRNNQTPMYDKRDDEGGGAGSDDEQKRKHNKGDDNGMNNVDNQNRKSAEVVAESPADNNNEEMNIVTENEDSNTKWSQGKPDSSGTTEKKTSLIDDEENKGTSVEQQKESNSDYNNDSMIKKESSFEDETNIELLKQYVAIDYEITQLEDKDTLMVYHEKIEQLEQLERELDMISTEAEEVAARSEVGFQSSPGGGVAGAIGVGGGGGGGGNNSALTRENNSNTSAALGAGNNKAADGESNSMISGATGSMSHKSWTGFVGSGNNQSKKFNNKDRQLNGNHNSATGEQETNTSKDMNKGVGGTHQTGSQVANQTNNTNNINNNNNNNNNNSSYSTVEEVFNRKIILEKERDKLKKEVELVIIECDKLQQRYKKRDEILDKLFDGRAGNGLENHLEQQLNWLLEQKHYVDQVFYSWKRAETLTSQTCEQFASALELLKRLPQIQQADQRDEIAKLIGNLLIKSRQDMEQAQRYNPNVDAPFFTDNETERFDKIIETISSNSISPSEYSQILTVIQFAYKRAVSIRLWLEQILQTTIARDSFELAEEYKWIAIQLRKERINLIKLKLQDEPYRSIAQSVLEEIVRQQTIVDRRQQQELNRDSGVESEINDVDIEEEIYRLLELNKARLEDSMNNVLVATTSGAGINSMQQQQQLKVSQQQQNHEYMRDRIEKRIQGQMATNGNAILHQHQADISATPLSSGIDSANSTNKSAKSMTSIGTPTKLRIELDEAARQNLLKQVDQIHNKHKSRIDRLKGSNKAKANNFIMNRLQEKRKQVSKSETPENSSDLVTGAAAYGLI